MLISQLPVLATQNVMLKWNPSADTTLTGYRIYYGTASHDYTNTISVGNVTNSTINGLMDGTTYFFAATSTDSSGNESDFSNEATFTTAAAVIPVTVVASPVVSPSAVIVNQPPTLNDLTNLTMDRNAGAQTIALSGITAGSSSEKQTLKVTVSTSNPNVVANPTVNYISPKSTGSLTFKSSSNFTGSSIITVTVNDGGKSNNIVTKKFTITVVTPPNFLAPKFTKIVTNTFATVGQTISLSVAVTGMAPLKYQWKFNGVNLPGATSPSLTLQNVKTSQAGNYSVSVSNAAGSVNSGVALLSVNRASAAKSNSIAQPNSQLAIAATLTSAQQANGQFTFTVSGVSGYTYVVQASSDLKKWEDVQTNTAPFTFTDVNASGYNQRFYRTYYLP